MHRYDNGKGIAAFVASLNKGERCEIDEPMYWYFLEVLPPRFMGRRTVELCDGTTIAANFGFAEGDGVPIEAFWQKGDLYFAQRTKLRTR